MSDTIHLPLSISQYLTNLLGEPEFIAIVKDRLEQCSDSAIDLYNAQIIQLRERDMGCVNKNSIPTLLRLAEISYDDFLLSGKELRYHKLNRASFKYPSHSYLPDVFDYIAPKLSDSDRFKLDSYIAELQSWVGNDGVKPTLSLKDKIKKKK
jgi:hypothetical protein